MRKTAIWLGLWVCAFGLLTAIAGAGRSEHLVFLSTQLRPIEEAQKMRSSILKGFPQEVDYITGEPQQFLSRIKGERETFSIDVVGALHGELQPLVPRDDLAPLDDLAKRLTDRGIPDRLLMFGKFGTAHQLYIPWMQATYLMLANKKALPYLPSGADINALSYEQLGAWANSVEQNTSRRLLGFPAGPQGLMYRFFEGFLYPSYTGGVVVSFRSEAAVAMWEQFALLWKSVNPNSTSYNFMRQPLFSGDVWIGFDHIARVLEVLRQKPDEFVAFPAPAGPKGRGYTPVLAGLAVLKGAPDVSGAMALIDYLVQPETQIATTRSVGFLPVVKVAFPSDLDAGLRMAATTIDQMQSATDALPALLPIGLGEHGSEFDRVFMDTFQLIVLRGQNPHTVLDREAQRLNRLMVETGAPCWLPDPPSIGACQAL
jgi:multiple sugar transport system substrate-binding protein